MKKLVLILGLILLSGCAGQRAQETAGTGVPTGQLGVGVDTELPEISGDVGVNVSAEVPEVTQESLGDAI